jgi:hypothetical protein
MKRMTVFLVVMLIMGGTFAASQPVSGKKFEFSTAASLFSVKYKYAEGGYSDSWTVLNVPIRFGWFAWKGLEIEPEFMLTLPIGQDKGESAYFLAVNIAYNFKAKGRLVPFIGGTAGIGNGIPYMGWVSGGSGEQTKAAGGLAGVKFLFSNVAALRAEYHLLFYKWTDDDFPEDNETGTIHQVLLGLSIFF